MGHLLNEASNEFVQYWSTPAMEAFPQWGTNRPEHGSCGGKSGCSMANANQLVGLGFHSDAGSEFIKLSYGQNLVHGEGTSLSRVGPYRFCSGSTLDKPSWGYRLRYRFRLGPYPFCSDGNPTTLSILLWSYLILSDIQMESCSKPGLSCYVCHVLGLNS